MIRRREVLAFLGGTAAAWPVMGARAQQVGHVYRLGVLSQSKRNRPQWSALLDELRLAGFKEGENLELIPGGFDTRVDKLAASATALVAAKPDVIFTVGDAASLAAKGATAVIPICGAAEDVIAAGLVGSLSRPESNFTGVSMLSPDLDGKRHDILIEAAPNAKRIAALADASQATPQTRRRYEALRLASERRGIELKVFSARHPQEILPAITAARSWGAVAINVLASPMFSASRAVVFEQVLLLRWPAIFQWPDMADDGGFAAYGPPLADLYRQRARMVAKLFRGSSPSEIPIEQPTRFELVLNLKTARAIGHEIPAGLVLRADRLVE